MATSMLTQLDARRRQVAVNVKIVDVNLLNTEDFNTSFSFGIGDTFVVVDRGSAVVNFGGVNPPNAATTRNSTITPPVIQNPLQGADVFFDPNQTISVPGTRSDTVFVDPDGNITRTPAPAGDFLAPGAAVSDNPLDTGVTEVERGEDTVITRTEMEEPIFDEDGNQIGIRTIVETDTSLGDPGTITASVVDLFQFPDRFLSTLQAQVVSGNAKILTDPTMVIQEGQNAQLNLTQDIVKEVQIEFTDTAAGQRETRDVEFEEVGLILDIQVDRIDDNGFVTLAVNPEVSAPSGQVDLGDDQFATTVQRRQLQSGFIRLRDGQTLILSGIIQESDRTTVSKVPILGDLPLIGSLFRDTNRENQRQEVIVLLTPNILDDSQNSTFGYGYTPGSEARQMLRRSDFRNPYRR
jgi:type IV pilus assembly protein PilQ